MKDEKNTPKNKIRARMIRSGFNAVLPRYDTPKQEAQHEEMLPGSAFFLTLCVSCRIFGDAGFKHDAEGRVWF